MGYPNRRYRVRDGKLEKRWDAPDGADWFVNKADALAAAAKPAPAAPKPRPAATPAPPAAAAPPPMPTPTGPFAPPATDYESWKMPQLREELRTRTGEGTRPGASKKDVIGKLQELDKTGWSERPS